MSARTNRGPQFPTARFFWVLLAIFPFLPVAFAQPVIWVAPSLQRVGQTDAAGANTKAQIYAARGESESFQIVVRAPAGGLSNVNVTVSDLQGPGGQLIAASNLALFREKYVYISASSPNWGGSNQPLGAGWYTDPLIPFNDPNTGAPLSGSSASLKAVPFSVAAGQNQPIWVDVNVPRGVAAGVYTGTYTVTSNQGNAGGQIAVTVWNFTLPLQPALKSSFGMWGASDLASAKEMLRNKLMPSAVGAANEPSLMSAFGLNAVNAGFWSGADIGACTMGAAPSVASVQAAVASHAPGLYLYAYTADEIDNCPALFPILQQWGAALHQGGLDQLVTIPPQPALFSDGTGSGRSAVDDWVILPFQYDQHAADVATALAKGDEVWSYNCLVQDSYSPKWLIDWAPMNFRIQPGFINASLGLSGLLYWRVDRWTANPWNDVNAIGWLNSSNYPGDGMLMYPGSQVGISGCAPSMRLKWLRDGVEDYDYVQILKGLGQASFALQVARSVGPDWKNWTRDISALENARLQLGQKIDQLSGGSAPPPQPPPPQPPPPQPPPPGGASAAVPTSLSPSSGSGSSQTFAFIASDPAGYADIGGMNILINTSASGATGCWLYFDRAANTIALADDTGANWSQAALGGGSLQNSRCAVNAAASAAAGSGNDLTLKLALSFTSVFAGAKTIYVRAANNAGVSPDGYKAMGTWTVYFPPPAASLVSLAPASGSGSSQAFQFVLSDPAGFTDIGGMNVIINDVPSIGAACAFYYDRAANTIALADDQAVNWASAVLGSATPLQNSQCSVTAAGSSAAGSGNTLTVTVSVNFTTAFTGARNLYVRVQNTAGQSPDGYKSAGAWTVTAPQGLTLVSVTPTAGAGSGASFTFVVAHGSGYSAIAWVDVLINSGFSGARGCWLAFDRVGRTISLANDTAAAWSAASVGSAVTLSNSQCAVNAAGVVVQGAGANLSLTVPIAFKPAAFAGARAIYMYAQDSSNSSAGYTQKGAWTVQ